MIHGARLSLAPVTPHHHAATHPPAYPSPPADDYDSSPTPARPGAMASLLNKVGGAKAKLKQAASQEPIPQQPHLQRSTNHSLPPLASSSAAVHPAAGPSRAPSLHAHNGHSAESSIPSPVSSTFSGLSTRSTAASSMHVHLPPPVPPPPLLLVAPSIQTTLSPTENRLYTVLKEVGDGSFGTVWLVDWHSPLTVPPGTLPPGPSSRPEYRGKKLMAMKKMKKMFDGGWDECCKHKELKSLLSIPAHPNIIPLYDAFIHPASKELSFVFECMEGNLYQLTKSRRGRPLAGGLTASIFQQTLLGLHHIHNAGYFHRDMKPENLLITTTGLCDYPHGSPFALPSAPPERDVVVTLKIADFGLARETASLPPYTEYVSTRWYRAPEVLLRSRDYSNPVDMWALGAIMAEAVTLRPLFPGDSEMDQVNRICELMGDPKHAYGLDDKGRLRGGGQWKQGVALADAVGFRWPDKKPQDFMRLFDMTNVPIQLVDCIHDLLLSDPAARLTTLACLQHAYFRDIASKLSPTTQPPPPPPPPASAPPIINAAAQPITPVQSSDGFARPALPTHSQSQPALNYAQPPYSNAPVVNGQNLLSPPQSAQHMNIETPGSARVLPSSHAYGYHSTAKPTFGTKQSGDHDSIMSDAATEGGPISPVHSNGNHAYSTHSGPSTSSLQAHGFPSHSSLHPGHASSQHRQSLINASSTASPTHSYFPQQASSEAGPSRLLSIAVTSPSDSTISPSASQRSLADEVLLRSPASFATTSTVSTVATQASQHKSRTRLGSLFHSHGSQSSTSLKRTTSDQVQFDQPLNPAPVDAKKARKEAEKIEKEAAKAIQLAKREEQIRKQAAAAKAVMAKQRRLAQAGANDVVVDASFAAPLPVTKLKTRSVLSPALPQIMEDGTRLRAVDATRFGRRRRGEDDADVHSVSSGETQPDDRRFSIASGSTMESDPGALRGMSMIHRSGSHQSANSAARLYGTTSSPNLGTHYRASTAVSTTSSLEHQLVANMAGLSAGESQLDSGASSTNSGWPAATTRPTEDMMVQPHHGGRAKSPTGVDPRYSPYNYSHGTNHHRPTLPGIQAFDFPPGTTPIHLPSSHHHHYPMDRHRGSVSSSVGSLLSSAASGVGRYHPPSSSSSSLMQSQLSQQNGGGFEGTTTTTVQQQQQEDLDQETLKQPLEIMLSVPNVTKMIDVDAMDAEIIP